jgi:HEPN domain-containing protein
MNISVQSKKWKRLADMDLLTATHMFETTRPVPLEVVCFHSQQAAEKMLKCFLVFKGIVPPKTHDLKDLLKMCTQHESVFTEITQESALLTDYGVLPRYPAELELEEQDGKRAIKCANRVRDFVNGIVFPDSDESEADT